jgi:hypothetical protein
MVTTTGTEPSACVPVFFKGVPPMDYGMIGKIEKAKRYAEEPERFQFDRFAITFRGDTMALERLLDRMLAVSVRN